MAALLWASAEAVACPICLGAGQPSKAQELVTAPDVVLAVPTRDAGRFRVTQVIKGKRPPGGTIEGGYPRSGPVPGTAAPRSGKPLLLVRDEQLPTWEVLGAIDAGHSGWLREGRRRQARGGHERRGVARPRRARRSLSREPGAAGGRDRLRRAHGRAVCRIAGGDTASRRIHGPPVAGGPGPRGTTGALPVAAWVRRQRPGRRRPRAAPGRGLPIGRCDEPRRDAGRGPGAARRRPHEVGRRQVPPRPRSARRARSRR